MSAATGEIYLTELVAIAHRSGLSIHTTSGSADDLVGVNDRAELAAAESAIYARTIAQLQQVGVSFVRPETSTVDATVLIGSDTVILPGCLIQGSTTIGEGCVIGPNTVLVNANIASDCEIKSSWIEDSSIGQYSDVGPYSHIRSTSEVGPGVHIGNFAELKNARLASNIRVGHFGYLGDVSIGERTNIGAGVVTCNYDGKEKHVTTVGADVFVGSDTMLVAPVELGDGAVTGAGSVVTKNVPAGVTVVGIPAKPMHSTREGK